MKGRARASTRRARMRADGSGGREGLHALGRETEDYRSTSVPSRTTRYFEVPTDGCAVIGSPGARPA